MNWYRPRETDPPSAGVNENSKVVQRRSTLRSVVSREARVLPVLSSGRNYGN